MCALCIVCVVLCAVCVCVCALRPLCAVGGCCARSVCGVVCLVCVVCVVCVCVRACCVCAVCVAMLACDVCVLLVLCGLRYVWGARSVRAGCAVVRARVVVVLVGRVVSRA